MFRRQKRLHEWLNIAKQLHAVFEHIHFIIAGDGVLKEEIHALAAQLQMQGYLHFAGMQTDVRPYLKAMDIFMMTSEFEGLPLALLEAMSMGCMPACTAAGGIAELIENNINGVLVPVNEPAKLVTELYDYIENPEKIKDAARRARERVTEKFSIQTMVNQLEEIYSETISV